MSRGPRVLIGCYEAPGWGGAATVAHDLTKNLQEIGAAAAIVTIVDDADLAYYRYVFGEAYGNPLSLADSFVAIRRPGEPSHELSETVARFAPDVVVAAGGVAAAECGQAAPNRRLIFLAAGCQQAKLLIASGAAADVVDLQRVLRRLGGWPPKPSPDETVAAERADLILPNCELVRSLFQTFYPTSEGKIYPEALSLAPWIADAARAGSTLARPFADRDIDVLFVSSAWDRPEKNYDAVLGLIPALRGRSIHVVGEVDARIDGAVFHGLLADRASVFALMGRAKTLVCPSVFDAAPGVLFEASVLGCNVVATANCGNVDICHPDLIAPRATADGLHAPIVRSLERSLEDRFAPPSARQATDRLLGIVDGVANVPYDIYA